MIRISALHITPSEWLERRWVKKTDFGHRYYHVLIQQDLFGDWILTRIWGGSLREAGQVKEQVLTSRSEGIQILDEIAKRRKAHSYKLLEKNGFPTN